MLSRHLKRLNLPKAIQIPRKEHKFAVKVISGPHGVEESLPLGLILRDYLKLVDTMWEAKKVLNSRVVYVDNVVRTDHKFPLGLMDVLSIPSIGKYYRILYDIKGRLILVEIPKEESTWKLLKIENITMVKGNKYQYNFHDGRNLVLNEKIYKTGDSIKYDLQKKEILEHIPMAENTYSFITGGKSVGRIARIDQYIETKSSSPNIVKFKEGFETISDFVFPVGTVKPLIMVPEVNLSEQ
ncbi:MAG: 30S ribosomal protein S4e [Thermoplasmata archaeon]